MTQADTIAAIATPGGRGGIGIVRISGPAVRSIARAVLGRLPAPRRAEYHRFRAADGESVDAGIALFFPAPNSFTGEDVLELQGHGGPVVLDMVLERLLELGARLARPGEFSERAFLNDRLDLAQAEAIADLIDSGSRTAARSSLRSLEGEFSVRVHALVDGLTMLRVRVEAGIDFPEEEIDLPGDSALREGFDALDKALATLIEGTRQGCLMREGIRVVIAGAPNVGKSSLLNRLARRDTAIVSDIPGTTRDVLREHIEIDGLPLHVVDTAGLRDSNDPIERIGIARARAEIEQADRILLLVEDDDTTVPVAVIDPASDGCLTILRNKIDLSGRPPAIFVDENGITTIRLSARSDAGIDLLRRHLKACMGYVGDQEGGFIARRRHLEALRRAGAHLDAGRQYLGGQQAIELAAEELRQAQLALGEITGAVSSDELLGHIFASFCLGK